MSFTVLTQMEASRQQKETILVRRSNTWPLISAGSLLVLIAIFLIGISLIEAPVPVENVPSNASSSVDVTMYVCAACFGIPSILLLLAGALLNLNTRRQVEKAEQEYQKLRYQVIDILEER